MIKQWVKVAVGLGVGFTVLIAVSDVSAQKTKGKTRPAATKYLMRGVTLPNCKGLGDLLKDTGPANDKAWDAAACNAACLSELSFLLMEDGRCPDGVWAGSSKKLQEGSEAVLAAVEKKDLDATKAAFKTVTQSCASCHDAHKPK